MAVTWTKEQEQIIGLKERNILVAAAAGSGKTAVLVERIMAMITDKNSPVDIDRLLVVTFTNAAAAQMRERIGKRLAEQLKLFPEDGNLRRQEDLLSHAKIMTIDSFWLHVVRNYFSFLDLDPDFRIGDEGELKLLREEAMGALLEEQYQEASPEFLLFVESYGEGKGDGSIAEYILKLYEFAAAYPEPERQLGLWREQLDMISEDEITETAWMRALMEELHLVTGELAKRYEAALALCEEDAALGPYGAMFRSDKRLAEELSEAENYREAEKLLEGVKGSFVKKPRIGKKALADEERKEFLSSLRDTMKKEMVALAEAFYLGPLSQVCSDTRAAGEPLKELIRLALAFGQAFGEAKREKNIVDFGDVAHFALRILTEPSGDGGFLPSETAVELSRSFHEIMIDEYQDSNWIQEAILNSVSKEREGRPNVFMVGDVKQSIYKFRQARPELFMEKYASYTKEESAYQKIDLHRNFRSREAVLQTANFLFGQLMEKRLGGITYDEDAALIPGRQFPEVKMPGEEQENGGLRTEVLLLDLGKASETEEEFKEYQAKELEARAVAGRIRQLVSPETGFLVLDKETGEYRTARYSDIVILLRTISGWAEVFTDVLMEAGIPAVAQTKTGYFTAREIRCILNLLRVIDNPMQDVPLAAVMTSPIGNFSSEEMALLSASAGREASPGQLRGLYGALRSCGGEERGEELPVEEELVRKSGQFLSMLADFREKAVYLRLHELLRYILEKTGYGFVLAAMPGGNIRRKNMEMLIKRAVDYENTSYRGVFQFVRYIEKLQKYSVDFGEAASPGGDENVVRITSIHKSKGLEYPIVILSGAGKPFNRQDMNRKILFHPELGIAADFVDVEKRVKAATLPKKVFQRRLRLEMLGEELRVLYVALTRAEEKLIITGADRFLETKLVKWNSLRLCEGESLPYGTVFSAGSYLDWILMALVRNRAYGEILSERGVTPPIFHPLYERELPVSVRLVTMEELVREEVLWQAVGKFRREEMPGAKGEEDAGLKEQLRDSLSYQYGYGEAVTAPRKFSVSELKREEREAEEEQLFREEETLSPRFLEPEEPLSGASRGTAYHKLLELLPFRTEPSDQAVRLAVQELEREGLLPKDTGQTLNLGRIRRFLASPLGRRMAGAERLKKEQQFVMGLPAKEIRVEYVESSLAEEIMLVQGIIDAWFEEDGALVVVDYKTDRVDRSDKEAARRYFVERYRTQLDYYQAALEMSTGKQVKERYIYSFSLEEAILL
ncbi:MAG: helicase-exonuclease AddAB subunit AddA [Lachnospiraceae bacterium]|nr:helicase-exonuclease AddAB subunit AddA [Lachnospiraceae bacterium]